MKIRIAYRLEALSGVLIGATAEALSIGIDRTTIRRRKVSTTPAEGNSPNVETEPEAIIPGSTLKGKIRHECERILSALGQKICRAPRAEMMCPHSTIADIGGKHCAVCQFFGGPSLQSRLFFSDAIVNDATLGRAAFRVQAGVSLSRRRRTAEHGRLYYIEHGVEGLIYEGAIDGYLDNDLADQQVALLIAALKRLVAVGSGKSRGLGWTKTEILAIEFDGREISKEQLQKIYREGLSAWHVSK
jgi:CRISPR/Cas system CSM-associated protein Csm3 (group 7 of RAMP superfamily)